MAIKYSEQVMEHFRNPRNVGELDNPDGVGEVGNPSCGDIMTFYIKVKDDKIDDVKFMTFGCGAAIAVSSMISELAKGKPVDEAEAITNKSVAEALGGLPKNKMHCSNLGADALRAAILSYKEKVAKKLDKPPAIKVDPGHDDEEEESKFCHCPYCDIENPADAPFCNKCGKPLSEDKK